MLFDELNEENCLLYNRVAGQVTDATFELHIYNHDLGVLDCLIDQISLSRVCIVLLTPPYGLRGHYLSQHLKKRNTEQVLLHRFEKQSVSKNS